MKIHFPTHVAVLSKTSSEKLSSSPELSGFDIFLFKILVDIPFPWALSTVTVDSDLRTGFPKTVDTRHDRSETWRTMGGGWRRPWQRWRWDFSC